VASGDEEVCDVWERKNWCLCWDEVPVFLECGVWAERDTRREAMGLEWCANECGWVDLYTDNLNPYRIASFRRAGGDVAKAGFICTHARDNETGCLWKAHDICGVRGWR